MSPARQNAEFDSTVMRPLRRLGRSLRSRVLVAGLSRCAAIALMLVTVDLGLDMLLSLGVGPRAALLCLMVGIFGRLIWLEVLRPLGVRMTLVDLAALFERRIPALQDRLISAVAFAGGRELNPHRNSPALVAALLREAQAGFQGVVGHSVLDQGRHRRAVASGLAVLLAATSAGAMAPDVIATYLARDLLLRDVPWPSRTRIVIEGAVHDRLRWPLGDDLTLVARAEGETPPGLGAEIQWPDGRMSTRETSRRGGDQFLLQYGPLDRSFRVRFLVWKFGADQRTGWIDVEAVERPGIRHATITLMPPAYVSKTPFSLPRDETTASLLRGSRVRIVAQPTKPVVHAALSGVAGLVAAAEILPDGMIQTELTPVSGGAYSFDLVDAAGLRDLHPRAFVLRIEADPPPKVRLSLPGVGEMIVPTAVPRLVLECEDNLALRSIRLSHRVIGAGGDSAASQPTFVDESWPAFEPGQNQFRASREWPLSGLDLKPGDQLALLVRAADFQPGPGDSEGSAKSTIGVADPGVTDSAAITLKVVTPEELLNELARRESEWRRELEHILKSQEQLNRRVVDLHDQAARGAWSDPQRVEYDRQERSQRGQSGRLQTVRRQYQQILDELNVNQLADASTRRRLEEGVLGPLARLAGAECPAAADLMQRLRGQHQRETAEQVEQAQARIMQQMYAILANMLKWEGYNEAVALMRDILRLQEDVNRQTQTRLDRQIEGLFGPGPASRPAGRKQP